ncbi:MAG: S9 family peptidase [Candidatus Aminicenantes bacterium]|nr:S9 family peptidase [Candidatus Aminicenantes bacterium]
MRYLLYSILFVTCLFMAGGWSAYGAEPHPFTVYDLWAMDRISAEKVSPDGKVIVFVLRKTDLEANKGRTDLWLIGADGKGLKQLTTDPAGDNSPCWSKDGKWIYFLSTRSGSSQVWRIPAAGGKEEKITDEPLDVDNLTLAPDGTKFAFTMEVFPGKDPKATATQLDEIKNRKVTGRIYDRLFVRHWDAWCDGRRSHIFVMPSAGGAAVDIMKAMDADSPVKPFGGSDEFAFTPDGKAIVFTAADNGREEAWSTNYDLFLSPIDGSRAPQCLTGKNKARDASPVFSPDGKTMAYRAMRRAGFEADRFYIILRSWADGKEQVLAENWDFSANTVVWAPDGKTIYTTAANLGQESLFAIDVKKGTVKTIVKEGNVTSFALTDKGKRIVYGMSNLKTPLELYSIDTNGKNPRTITAVNAEKLATVKMGDPEQFTCKGWNDETIYCYIVKPVDFDPMKKYPVAFLIHGGPQGSFGNNFHYRWNPQTYTGAGYAVVMVDFHGSVGYGQAFCDSISGDWGGKPLEDLKKGLAAALERYPWMDGDRVGALGASYGAYMINWIAGNWPDGFRCLISHDGNLDERTAYFDTEELWFPEWDHQGTPWDNPEGYEKHNPVNFVKNWKTPMLVIHSALDFRVVETQGLSTFSALQRKGIPSKLLYFPDENHWVLKPHNGILWHETVLAWMDQWLKDKK